MCVYCIYIHTRARAHTHTCTHTYTSMHILYTHDHHCQRTYLHSIHTYMHMHTIKYVQAHTQLTYVDLSQGGKIGTGVIPSNTDLLCKEAAALPGPGQYRYDVCMYIRMYVSVVNLHMHMRVISSYIESICEEAASLPGHGQYEYICVHVNMYMRVRIYIYIYVYSIHEYIYVYVYNMDAARDACDAPRQLGANKLIYECMEAHTHKSTFQLAGMSPQKKRGIVTSTARHVHVICFYVYMHTHILSCRVRLQKKSGFASSTLGHDLEALIRHQKKLPGPGAYGAPGMCAYVCMYTYMYTYLDD
jgi:hypothetical protein